jgi:hypothetical protein
MKLFRQDRDHRRSDQLNSSGCSSAGYTVSFLALPLWTFPVTHYSSSSDRTLQRLSYVALVRHIR